MPFPLAHPAAVLPLRRTCPAWLNFPALVIGSLVPDAGYLLRGLGDLSHHLRGLLLFCLPAGLAAFLLFKVTAPPVLALMPASIRQIFLPTIEKHAAARFGVRALVSVIVSILLGAVTHVFWDSATHRNGWLVQHVPLLRQPLLAVGHRHLRLCYILWYGSTFAGVACLAAAYQNWRLPVLVPPAARPPKISGPIIFGLLVLPIALAHHTFHSMAGNLAVAGSSLLVILAFVYRTEHLLKNSSEDVKPVDASANAITSGPEA
jgi:hypothetical protein